MEQIINNWYLLVVFIVVVICGFLGMQRWLKKPNATKVANIKQWLLFAVTEAERQLGGGTGQLKLRLVYDWAIERFKWLAVVPFTLFAGWVDEALEGMKKQLSNKAIEAYVKGDVVQSEGE